MSVNPNSLVFPFLQISSVGGPSPEYEFDWDGAKYVPYATDAAACTKVPVAARAWQRVNVNGVIKWWPGSNTSDAGLVVFLTPGATAAASFIDYKNENRITDASYQANGYSFFSASIARANGVAFALVNSASSNVTPGPAWPNVTLPNTGFSPNAALAGALLAIRIPTDLDGATYPASVQVYQSDGTSLLCRLNFGDFVVVRNVSSGVWSIVLSGIQTTGYSDTNARNAVSAASGTYFTYNPTTGVFAVSYTPLNPASNLSDVANPATARANLGITAGDVASTRAALSAATGSYLTYNTSTGVFSVAFTPENPANKAADLSAPNGTGYPTTQAVATAIANAVTQAQTYTDQAALKGINFAGGYSVAGNPGYPAAGAGTGTGGAIRRGDQFYVTGANADGSSTLAGLPVKNNDVFVALSAAPGQTAANWDVQDANVFQATETAMGNGKVALITDVQNEATTNDTGFVTPKKFWQGLARLLAKANTWAGVQTFTLAPIFSSAGASQFLLTDASKNLTSKAPTTTDIPEPGTGATNLYFSNSRVLNVTLVGYAVAANYTAIAVTDTISQALAKVEAAIKALPSGTTAQLAQTILSGLAGYDTTVSQMVYHPANGTPTWIGSAAPVSMTGSVTGQSSSNAAGTASPMVLGSTENSGTLTAAAQNASGTPTFAWTIPTKPSGSGVVFNGTGATSTVAAPTFISASSGTTVFQVVITDSKGSVTVQFTVTKP